MQIVSTRKTTHEPVNPRLTLKGAPRSNLTTSEDSWPMISNRWVSHPKNVGAIISSAGMNCLQTSVLSLAGSLLTLDR